MFAGGWSAAAAEDVCGGDGISSEDVLGLLMSLVDQSLVVADDHTGEGRYRLLETLRHYGLERLRDSGEESSLRQRHRDWCLSLVERTDAACDDARKDASMQALERERDNLRAASRWCLERGEVDVGLRLTVAGSRFCSLHHLARLATERGDADHSAALRAEGLGAEGDSGVRRDVAACLETQAVFFASIDPGRAARLFGAAEALREDLGVVLSIAEHETNARGRALAGAALGQTTFAAAFAEGRLLPIYDAVELSLAATKDAPSCTTEGADRRPVCGAIAPLTTREAEVSRLIGMGLSNREIAETLVIAERTAEAHVTHVLNKLGLRSRAQVAVWAVEHGLANARSV